MLRFPTPPQTGSCRSAKFTGATRGLSKRRSVGSPTRPNSYRSRRRRTSEARGLDTAAAAAWESTSKLQAEPARTERTLSATLPFSERKRIEHAPHHARVVHQLGSRRVGSRATRRPIILRAARAPLCRSATPQTGKPLQDLLSSVNRRRSARRRYRAPLVAGACRRTGSCR